MAPKPSGGGALPKLSAPAQRALAAAGVKTLRDVAKMREADVKELHGIGPNAITALRAALKAEGLSFADGAKAKR